MDFYEDDEPGIEERLSESAGLFLGSLAALALLFIVFVIIALIYGKVYLRGARRIKSALHHKQEPASGIYPHQKA